MKSKMNVLIEEQKNVHVLYSYKGMENYIEQVLGYIEDGIAAGDYVILIENDRVCRIILKELNTRLSKDQMEFIHIVNSFDFYYSSGSYHPPAIFKYFNKIAQRYVENKTSFRAWAHVEWATMEEPLYLIEDLEKIVDKASNQLLFPLVCAYDGEKMSHDIETILLETHPYILMEDDFIVSKQYKPS